MSIINLKNVIALGVLDDGIYPNAYDDNTKEYVGTGSESDPGVNTTPTLYLYYRKNGHLYLYRTTENIEIDLTNVTAYDNTALFKLTEKDNIEDCSIKEFDSRNINVGKYEYSVPWVKPNQQYLYILVPLVKSIHTILIQNIISNQIFTLQGIYVYDDKSWWIYRSNVKSNFNFKDVENEVLNVLVIVRELTGDDLAPVEQLTKLLTEHINNVFNPHHVTKDQVGLSNVDNTADIDKPVSNPQKEYIKSLEDKVISWFKQLNTWINNHVDEVNRRFKDLWIAVNNKLDISDYEDDKDNFNNHTKNFDNPHRVTASQIGLGSAAKDISDLKIVTQQLENSVYNKQDKQSDRLDTDSKNIVDAINEIYSLLTYNNLSVKSNSIKQIEVTTEIPSDIKDNVLWVRIPKNDEDYVNVEILSVDDGYIKLVNSEGKIVEGFGNANIDCLINTVLHYTVSKEQYYDKDVYLEVGVEDAVISVVLIPRPINILTVKSIPFESAIFIIRISDNETLVSGFGEVQYSSYYPDNLRILIQCDGYLDYSEDIIFDESLKRTILLQAKPIPKGYVKVSTLDTETEELIPAYIYDKDSGVLLGQVEKNKPLELTNDLNTKQILSIIANGYNEAETLVTYTDPAFEATIKLNKTVPLKITVPFRVQNISEEPIVDGLKAKYTIDGEWIDIDIIDNTFTITVITGTSILLNISANNYITKEETILLNSDTERIIVLEEVPPEPTISKNFKLINSEGEAVTEGLNIKYTVNGGSSKVPTISGNIITINEPKKSVIVISIIASGYIYKEVTDNFEDDSEVSIILTEIPPTEITNNIKVVDKNSKPITDGFAYFSYSKKDANEWTKYIINKELVCTISNVENTEYNYKIIDVNDQEYEYASGVFTIKSPDNSDIVITWDRTFENDGIDYMEIQGIGLKHPIFRVL